MRPFLLVAGDFVRSGGMDRCNHALALYLANRGNETHLVAYRAERDLLEHPNIRLHQVTKPLGSYFLANPLLARRGTKVARRIAARGGRVVVNGGNCIWPDVNWVHLLHAEYRPAVEAGIPRKIKSELQFRLAASAERRALACARLIVATSAAIRREMVRALGIPEQKIVQVDLGIDSEMFQIPSAESKSASRAALGLAPGEAAVVFVGAIGDRRKGFDTLYEAWRILCRDPAWNARLVVIGEGFELPTWKSRARCDGLTDRILFLGSHGPPSFVADTLAGCDVMAAPTRYEGYGMAIQEAVCCGLPVVASRKAPVIERFEGLLSELAFDDPDDVNALAERLKLWHSRREDFGKQAALLSERLRRWTWDDMAARMVEIIEEGHHSGLSVPWRSRADFAQISG
jgi:glycosyltransferase involved in cell wall biosynthesis